MKYPLPILITAAIAFCASASPASAQNDPFRFGTIPYGKSPEEVAALAQEAGIPLRDDERLPFLGYFAGATRFLTGSIFRDGMGFTYLDPNVTKSVSSSSESGPQIHAYFYRDLTTGQFRLLAVFKKLAKGNGPLETVFDATKDELTKTIGVQPDVFPTEWTGNVEHQPARVAHWQTADQRLFLTAFRLFFGDDIEREVGYVSLPEWQRYIAASNAATSTKDAETRRRAQSGAAKDF